MMREKQSPASPQIVVHDCRSPLRVDQLGRLSLHTACLPENQLRFRVVGYVLRESEALGVEMRIYKERVLIM